MLTAITGVNWGDEGKGRMVDLLSEQYDIVVRYQGGNNAGHTVINEKGKFILNLLPSGILRETTVNVMGNGMVIDLEHLVHEIENLRRGGIAEVSIYPRDVLEAALLRKASGIILVHNHPGGNPGPSQEDRLLTEELQRLAPRMGLRFLDHVIVTDGDCYSITQSQRI